MQNFSPDFNRLRTLKNAEKDQRELNRKLNYDALTGLPIYNKFVDKLEAYMAAHGKSGLFLCHLIFQISSM